MLREYIDAFKTTNKASQKIISLEAMEIDFIEIDEEVKTAWLNYKEVVGNELLNNMPIERLNDVETGMPIKVLQSYGLNFIGDCSDRSEQYFERFSGIGEVKSKKIVDAVDSLRLAVFDEIDFKIKENSKV